MGIGQVHELHAFSATEASHLSYGSHVSKGVLIWGMAILTHLLLKYGYIQHFMEVDCYGLRALFPTNPEANGNHCLQQERGFTEYIERSLVDKWPMGME